MQIKEDEIKEIKKIGNLNGSEVKLVTLKGGFHIGLGKKSKTATKSDILAVGSHPALVSHQISKKYDANFEQIMSKHENADTSSVLDLSHNLNSMQKNVLGLDIVAIKKNQELEFKITKHNFEVFSIKATEDCDHIVLEKTEKNLERIKNTNKKDLSDSLAKSIEEYAKNNNLSIKKKF